MLRVLKKNYGQEMSLFTLFQEKVKTDIYEHCFPEQAGLLGIARGGDDGVCVRECVYACNVMMPNLEIFFVCAHEFLRVFLLGEFHWHLACERG